MKFIAPLLVAFGLFSTAAIAGPIRAYDQAAFEQAAKEGRPSIVVVHATWCPTCKAQAPILKELMNRPEYERVTMFTVDFDTAKALLRMLKVGMQSTLIGYHGTQEVGRSVGDTTREGIEGLVKKTLG